MGQYLTESADGQKYNFKIKGDVPSPEETSRIQSYLTQGKVGPQAANEPVDPNRIGVGESMSRHLQRAGKQITAGGANMVALGLSYVDPDNPELQQQVGDLRGYAEKTSNEGAAIETGDKGFMEAMREPTWGGVASEGARSLLGTLVESAPAMVAGVATGIVTRSPTLAVAAGSMFSIPQAMDSNVQRQIQEHGRVTDWNKAGLSAIGQGVLEHVFDLPLGKMAGVFGRPARFAEVIDNSVKKAWSEAYKKTGKGLSVGAITNAIEEASQQGMERWQADLPLLDDEAKAEYLENALVGSILGTAIGGVAGVAGGIDTYSNIRNAKLVKEHIAKREESRSAMKEAMDDADADAAAMRSERTPTSAEAYEPKAVTPATAEEDHSAPTAEAALPVSESETALPPGLRESATVPSAPVPTTPLDALEDFDGKATRLIGEGVTDPVTLARELGTSTVRASELLKGSKSAGASTRTKPVVTAVPPAPSGKIIKRVDIPKPSPSLFSEADYRKSVDALRSFKALSEERVAKTLKLEKSQARVLMDEMIKRKDAKATGRLGQYARIIAPKANVPSAIGPTATRDYSIKPIIPDNHAPFSVEMNGKKRSPHNYKTQAEALDWIATNVPKNQQKSVTVAEDPTTVRHGVYETVSDGGVDTHRMVSSHDTEADAKAALKDLDPAYSALTNEQTRPTPEAKKAEVERDVKAILGPYNILQNTVERMVGANRVGVDITSKIDDRYMAKKGHKTDINEAIVEGVFTKDTIDDTKKIFQRIISLANLSDTNLSKDQRDKRISDTLNHEIIHAIVNLRLLSPGEWGALMRAATEQKVPGKNYTWAQRAEARNPDLRREGKVAALLEEGVAEMFRHYVNDPSIFKGEVKTALGKIADFVRKLIGLGRKHDAQQIMDAIFSGDIGQRQVGYGGTIPRDSRDVRYSLTKPDNFYLKSLRAIEATKQTSASPQQWLGTIRNAQVKQGELDWLGIEEWLEEQTAPIAKQEVMNFIKAVPDITVEIRGNLPTRSLPISQLHPSVRGYPNWSDMQTEGGTDYTEATLLFKPKVGEPDYNEGHWNEANVFAHVRFKTIMDGDKRVLFIEEMQSDLHQAALERGYYSKGMKPQFDRALAEYKQANDAYEAAQDVFHKKEQEFNQRRAVKTEALRQVRAKMGYTRFLDPLPDAVIDPSLKQEEARLVAELETLADRRDLMFKEEAKVRTLRRITQEKFDAYQILNEQMGIPNAPFKTTWEEYVIKRLVRHAAEHGFDGIAWHAETGSIQEAENWGKLDETIDLKRQPVETESWRPIPNQMTYHVGDKNVSPIVSRYLEKLPLFVKKLGKSFGAMLETKGAGLPAKRNYDSLLPPLKTEDDYRAVFPTPASFVGLIHEMEDKQRWSTLDDDHTQEVEDDQDQLINMFKRAYKITTNQNGYNPVDALNMVGAIDFYEAGQHGDETIISSSVKEALVWASPEGKWSDVRSLRGASSRPLEWKRYQMDFTLPMKEAFVRGDVPKFSKVEYGNVEARNRDDVFFSLLKPDNAYLKSLRVVENTKQEKATAEQWMSTFKNAGVKPEELWWQNIEGYLSAFNRPIPKQDLMNFIRGTPDMKVNYAPPNPNIRVNIRAEDDNTEFAGRTVGTPKYRHMQTKGGTDYFEATFFLTPKDNEPEYRHGHWPEENVLAHVRAKTVNEMGDDGRNRKVLFIEEMQSDLHQQASKIGGYYSEALRDEANQLHLEYENAEKEIQDFNDSTSEEARKLRNSTDEDKNRLYTYRAQLRSWERRGVPDHHRYVVEEMETKIARLEEAVKAPLARLDEIKDARNALKAKVRRAQDAWEKIDRRMWIPNAPYRTSWEDFVIRRLIRHAVEHDFDAIAWHGQQESVNEAENWGGITESIEESPVETESWRPLPKTYKVQGQVNVTPIVNRYLEKLPKIVKEMAQAFGAYLNTNDASPIVAAAAKAKGSSYTAPSLNNRREIEAAFPERKSISRLIDALNRKYSGEGVQGVEQENLIRMLQQSYQIALNQRDFDPARAFYRTDLITESLTGGFEEDFDSGALQEAMFWAHGSHTWADTLANKKGVAAGIQAFPFKHFRLDFNDRMKTGFTHGDVPRYSALKENTDRIEADPRFEQWFQGSTVVNPDGTPKVVYHYTKADQNFSRFNRLTHFGTARAAEERMAGSVGDHELIKADRDAYLDMWAQPSGQRMYPVFLNLRRPLRIKDEDRHHTAESYALAAWDAKAITMPDMNQIMKLLDVRAERRALDLIITKLERQGYDGFIYTNSIEDAGSTSYVSFRPEQIKSIFNQGTWDESNPDTMYSKLEERGRDLWQNDDKFKSWFSGSRVVDENGDPYLMFHGRRDDFDTFNESFSGTASGHPTSGLGFFFTAGPNIANDFTAKELDESTWPPNEVYSKGSNVIPAFLSIKNPFVMETKDFLALTGKTGWKNKLPVTELRRKLEANGYDGIRIKAYPDASNIFGYDEFDADAWVAFKPNQIKSALSNEFSAESDSFKFSKVEPKYMATAPLGSRVPPGPTPDRLEEILKGATYNNTAPIIGKVFKRIGGTALATKMGYPLEARVEGTVIQLQDHMQPLGKLVDQIRKNGGTITNENDPYLQQALMSGQVKFQIEENDRLFYEPLAKAIAESGVTARDADELKALSDVARLIMREYPDHRLSLAEVYLYAQHALERNAEMAQRNAKFRMGSEQQQLGSGMSDFEAQQILDWFSSKRFGRKFNSTTDPNSIRSRYRALIASTKEVRVNGGLTPDFRGMTYTEGPRTGLPVDHYTDYAPLRGFLKDHPNSIHDDNVFAHTGLGFNIRGKEDKSAAGRGSIITGGHVDRSLGANLIANAVLQNQEAVTRAGKNKVDQAFYKMIKDNPGGMALVASEITHTPSKWVYNSDTGNVQLRPDPMALNQPNVLKFKIAGDQKYLDIRDERIAKAMGTRPHLGGDGLGHAMLRGMRSFNKWFAMMVTSLNPEFLLKNWQRDALSALINLSEYDAPGLRAKVLASLKPAFHGASAVIRHGDTSSEWAKNYMEFQKHGGATAFQGIANLDDNIRKINKDLMTGGNSPNYAWNAVKATKKFIEDYNLAVENATRLAVYVTLRDHYLSLTSDPTNPTNILRAKEHAAFSAKRKTVDFNMGGEAKQWLNGLYVFYGASMNGTTALLNPLIRSPKVRKMFAAIITAGATQELLNALISPEDDDGKKIYDKIPDYILEHNLVLIDPFGISERGYFKLPLPFGYNGVYNFGRATASALRGKVSVGEAANSAFGTMADAFNPLGAANSWVNLVAPTVIDPFIDLYNNLDYTGAPIAPPASPYGPDEVASQRYWNNTSPFNITVADMISRLTGRTGDFLPGGIEVSPNQIGFLMEFAAGGLGSTVGRAYNFIMPEAMLGKGTLGKIATGDFTDVDANDVPFMRANFGNVTTKNDLQNYIKDRDRVLRVRAAIKDANKEHNPALAKQIREEYPNEVKVNRRINAIENNRKKLSAKIKKIRENVNIPDDQKQARIKILKERQDRIVGIGNRVMEEADIR